MKTTTHPELPVTVVEDNGVVTALYERSGTIAARRATQMAALEYLAQELRFHAQNLLGHADQIAEYARAKKEEK